MSHAFRIRSTTINGRDIVRMSDLPRLFPQQFLISTPTLKMFQLYRDQSSFNFFNILLLTSYFFNYLSWTIRLNQRNLYQTIKWKMFEMIWETMYYIVHSLKYESYEWFILLEYGNAVTRSWLISIIIILSIVNISSMFRWIITARYWKHFINLYFSLNIFFYYF